MADVYKNSLLTIAASSSPDSRTGCFLERESGSELKIQHGDCAFYLHHITRKWCFPSLNSGPLQTRAWVLQEMLLSRRILFFHKDQLFWECNSMSLSEEGSSRALDFEMRPSTMKQELLKLEYWHPDTPKIATSSPKQSSILNSGFIWSKTIQSDISLKNGTYLQPWPGWSGLSVIEATTGS